MYGRFLGFDFGAGEMLFVLFLGLGGFGANGFYTACILMCSSLILSSLHSTTFSYFLPSPPPSSSSYSFPPSIPIFNSSASECLCSALSSLLMILKSSSLLGKSGYLSGTSILKGLCYSYGPVLDYSEKNSLGKWGLGGGCGEMRISLE